MSNQISNLLNDAQSSFRQQRNETKALVNKWDKTGLLDGIDKEYEIHKIHKIYIKIHLNKYKIHKNT